MRRLRKERDITLYRLALVTGKKREWLTALERGDNEPKISTIRVIARGLGMEPWEMFREIDLAMREDESGQDGIISI